MRLLLLHADRFSYEIREATEAAEALGEQPKSMRFTEVLVAFATVEADDTSALAARAADEIAEVAGQVRAERIVVYPYAHLSPKLAAPKPAVEVLRAVGEALSARGLEVHRAPFGWYKAFELHCKGHPLSELSREIRAGELGPPPAPGGDRYVILLPSGEERPPDRLDGLPEAFHALVEKEALKRDLPSREEPGYLRLCRKFGIAWEEMSDAGHMAYEPKGTLLFDLVSDYSTQVVRSLGLSLFLMRGTNMFNLREDAVREHAELFGDRLYKVEHENRSFVMRYAACHQQFAIMRRWNISYRHLPLGAFEVADSYRLEQSGETSLLFRVRRLNMPDLHVLCRALPEANDWFARLHRRILQEAVPFGVDYEMLINLSGANAFAENRDLILQLLRERNRPALLHFYPEGRNYYWTVNIEYVMLDESRRPREIGTVQIDTGNAARFGIGYVDEQGRRNHPIILHTAIIGSVERYLYMAFEAAVQAELRGRKGALPLWLTPEQLRLLTVGPEHLPLATSLADQLEAQGFRVGLDDRNESIPKKVREAKQDWVGNVIVIGDRELKGEPLRVYDRSEDRDVERTIESLLAELRRRTEGFPKRPLSYPREMSRRVVFASS